MERHFARTISHPDVPNLADYTEHDAHVPEQLRQYLEVCPNVVAITATLKSGATVTWTEEPF